MVFGAANPKFLRPQSIMNSIVNYISVCIISLFVTLVMITGGIDIPGALHHRPDQHHHRYALERRGA